MRLRDLRPYALLLVYAAVVVIFGLVMVASYAARAWNLLSAALVITAITASCAYDEARSIRRVRNVPRRAPFASAEFPPQRKHDIR